MRELPRDLPIILRTEAANQRHPPIDYAIAEDGGRMIVKPDPDMAMAELLEEAAAALDRAEAARDEAISQLSGISRSLGEAEGKLAASEMAGIVEGWKARAERAEAEAERLRGALHKIANGDGVYGMQAGEYKAIARAALEGSTNEKAPDR